jgi:phosphatidylserine/phosphatidylglycerophosphate/cardiolipin synthase-like enzyme
VTSERLAAQIARFATELPPDQVDLAAKALGAIPGVTAAAAVVGLVPTEPFKRRITALLAAWGAAPSTDGPALALAMTAAASAHRIAASDHEMEVVWTGPAGGLPTRLTSVVLAKVMAESVDELLLVSFAAYRSAAILSAIRATAERGVRVRLVVDAEAVAPLRPVSDVVEMFSWPPTYLDDRHPDHASMHAKAAVADETVAFVTSANLTDFALEKNMELGILVRGGSVPRDLAGHFHKLIDGEVLVPVRST